MNQIELNKILEEHKKWLNGEEGCYADLRGADLRGADLYGANYNENTAFFALQCPEEGAFIAWKICAATIVKLLIPDDAKRSSSTTRKCRASKALVLAIYESDGETPKDNEYIAFSDHDNKFGYKVGETVIPDSFDEDRWNECSKGIHFFITKKEAMNY